MKYFWIFFFIISLVFNSVMATTPASPGATAGDGEAVAADLKKEEPKDKEEMKCTDQGDALKNCACTKKRALTECINPSGQAFKRAGQFILTLPSVATPFMTGGDSGQMAEMCKLAGVSSTVANLLNGIQGNSCERAITACTESCIAEADEEFSNKREKDLQAARMASPSEVQVLIELANSTYEKNMKQVERYDAECSQKATAQMQMAQQQMQASLSPIAGLQSCMAGLDDDNSGSSGSSVNCALAINSSNPQCSTVSKTNSAGNGVTYDPGVGIAADTDSEMDLPGAEDREDYWNALKNKTSGSGNGSGRSGMGALGSGGGSGGFGALGKGGSGAARKTGSSLLSGGSDSGGAGGGGWGNGGNEGFDKKYAKLGAKGKGLNMLTKKKIGGRQLASDLASSTEDIWTRVYLRTNTNCTKQLLECSANKSLNPYGLQKSR